MSEMLKKIEQALLSFLPPENAYFQTVIDSMKYSLMAGGKRVRPMLVLEFAKLCGGSEDAAIPFACAIEMIHTYSLIHDDLPCMDDDDLRRGRPTNHKVFGEGVAVLGGDGLLTLAFETVLSERAVALNGFEKCAQAGRILARFAGTQGMIGGQIIDIESENKAISLERLKEMDRNKTGALMKAACLMGCISAGADEEKCRAAEEYADKIGLAFQIVDDILDVISDEQTLGKPIGSDKENNKSTYVSLLGMDECRRLSSQLTSQAIDQLSAFANDTTVLKDFALYLRDRTN